MSDPLKGRWGIGQERISQGDCVIKPGAFKKFASGDLPRQKDGQLLQVKGLMTVAAYREHELQMERKISRGEIG